VPLLRHLARMGRPLVGLGAMAPSSLPTVDLMHSTQIAKPFHRAGWIYEEKVDGWRWWRPRPVARCDSSAGMAAMVEFEPDDRASLFIADARPLSEWAAAAGPDAGTRCGEP
jgi:hypothetical protein